MQSTFLTLYGQFTALAALFAVLMVHVTRKQTLRIGEDREAIEAIEKVDTLTLALCCVPAAFVGARLLYCLFRFDFYFVELGAMSVLRTWEGGFLLYGAALGAMLAAWALAKVKGVSPAILLDEIACPGMMAIAISRMAEGMTTEGVGAWIENELFWHFPIAVQNEWGEWQLAVFLFESLAAVVILFVLLRQRGCARGETVLSAVLLYACCQIVLESLRMDACLRIGFVRVSQVLSGVAALAVTLIRSLRVGKKQAAICGGLCLGGIAAAGIIEWALDKTSVNNLILYPIMIAVCVMMMVVGMRYMKKEAR